MGSEGESDLSFLFKGLLLFLGGDSVTTVFEGVVGENMRSGRTNNATLPSCFIIPAVALEWGESKSAQ